MNYEKILKWSLAGLLLVGVFFSIYGFIVGWPTDEEKWNEALHFPVDLILWGGYIFAGITILAVIFGVVVIGGMNDPKSLLKLGIGVVAAVVIVLLAYLVAPGTQPVGYLGEPVEEGTLMMTDTILNLAYLLVGGTIVSLIAGWIIGLTRK